MLISAFIPAFLQVNRYLLYIDPMQSDGITETEPDLLQSQTDNAETNFTGIEIEDIVGKSKINCSLYRREAQRCIKELKVFIKIICEVIIDFYDLKEVARPNICREQLDNFVTNQVLSDAIYIFLFNLITMSQLNEIKKLSFIFQHAHINLKSLLVKEVFQLSPENRQTFLAEHGGRDTAALLEKL